MENFNYPAFSQEYGFNLSKKSPLSQTYGRTARAYSDALIDFLIGLYELLGRLGL
jgi:hypothetical protein